MKIHINNYDDVNVLININHYELTIIHNSDTLYKLIARNIYDKYDNRCIYSNALKYKVEDVMNRIIDAIKHDEKVLTINKEGVS